MSQPATLLEFMNTCSRRKDLGQRLRKYLWIRSDHACEAAGVLQIPRLFGLAMNENAHTDLVHSSFKPSMTAFALVAFGDIL